MVQVTSLRVLDNAGKQRRVYLNVDQIAAVYAGPHDTTIVEMAHPLHLNGLDKPSQTLTIGCPISDVIYKVFNKVAREDSAPVPALITPKAATSPVIDHGYDASPKHPRASELG
ncbi:hypothetical protein E3E12_02370 [Formicincola oecophyllae]|uniref:Uncharacterized protein n=1 Tax=Formicincola oecophyllae TaxID=2558361 RepID=A0A4Y6U9V7_9PROT|nr:hypothetical protein [Formicincola oecophyllae]QDH13236.1 hypothetical protein E3E12_02370 [Formicincola oecophyllae]